MAITETRITRETLVPLGVLAVAALSLPAGGFTTAMWINNTLSAIRKDIAESNAATRLDIQELKYALELWTVQLGQANPELKIPPLPKR